MKNLFFLRRLVWLLLAVIALAACDNSGSAGLDRAGLSAAEVGQQQFVRNCGVCHGEEGEGVAGLGKNMSTSDFIASQSDAELVEFIKKGRSPADPLNTTGVAMPPKGGNSGLTDEELYDIVAFIRAIHKQ